MRLGGPAIGVARWPRSSARRASASRRRRRRPPRLVAPRVRALGARVGLGLGFGFGLGFLLQQRLPVGDRDLIVVGMDFVEGQEAVAVAAVVDEGRLQRRLDARHLGQIDVAAQQLAGGQLVVELLYPAVAQHHDPGFLRVRGIDEHLVLVHGMSSLRAAGRHLNHRTGGQRSRMCGRVRDEVEWVSRCLEATAEAMLQS